MWSSLAQDMAPLPVINRGFGGSHIEYVNRWFEPLVAAYRPSAIVFYAGENDLDAGKSPQRVIADFDAFLALKSAALGAVPVYFIPLKPSKLRFAQFAQQSGVNAAIRARATQRTDLFYIDVVSPMLEEGRPKDIYLADGYASDHIFKFDKTGKYLSHFGTKGNGLKEFNTAHGMTLDTRYSPPRLLICDRNHQPKGRLLHYDLDGKFIGEVVTGLGMPTSAAVQGDYVSVPDLHGRLVILDKTNTIMSVLGYNPDPAKGRNYNITQDHWVEGIFSGTHGSSWDKEGNLYVQDWNVSGRLMKLLRVK